MMIQLKGKNAILYRRVSTAKQKKNNSLSSQKDALREFCIKNEINIIKEYEEDYSAKNFERPSIQNLLKFSKENRNQIDYILISSWDRFARDVSGALNVIKKSKKYDIQINSINNWIDYNDPNQLILLLIHLGLPEVDNLNKSNKVKIGLRYGLKEGRWNMRQPIGYIKGKDENGKPLMKIDKEKHHLITELFLMFKTGLYSQNQLLKMEKFTDLKLSKSNLSRIFKNILYTGKVRVPANENEKETIVEGLHEPIININTFNKIQNILQSKRRIKTSSYDDVLFMRGYLQCFQCKENITGSGSRSKTGDKHFYYHCNPRKGCNERFRADTAHTILEKLISTLKPSEDVYALFKTILTRHYETTKDDKYNKIVTLQNDIKKLEIRKEKVMDKLVEQVINDSDYKSYNNKIDKDIITKKEILGELKRSKEDIKEYIEFGLTLFKNLDIVFKNSNHSVKRKLLSSIFDEKLEFNGEEYRTPKYKKGVEYIYLKINELEDFLNKKGNNLSKVSRSVPLKIPISNSFYNNLFELRNIADLLKKEGICFEKGKLINERMG